MEPLPAITCPTLPMQFAPTLPFAFPPPPHRRHESNTISMVVGRPAAASGHRGSYRQKTNEGGLAHGVRRGDPSWRHTSLPVSKLNSMASLHHKHHLARTYSHQRRRGRRSLARLRDTRAAHGGRAIPRDKQFRRGVYSAHTTSCRHRLCSSRSNLWRGRAYHGNAMEERGGRPQYDVA